MAKHIMIENQDGQTETYQVTELRSPKNTVVLSIDLDMWWHCRWAQGGPKSRWTSTDEVIGEYYDGDRSRALREFRQTIDKTLEFADGEDVKITYFILGEVSDLLPDVIREIASRGHEIACHGYTHTDATRLGPAAFKAEVDRGKKTLEDRSGQLVRGYRAPNLVVTPWMFECLLELGFDYDSSVCPARGLSGKYGTFSEHPSVPYRIHSNGSAMVELPIAVMPWIKLPSHSGIFARFFGLPIWTNVAQSYWGPRGTTNFYFHPFEICKTDCPSSESLYMRAFFKGSGEKFYNQAAAFVRRVKADGRIARADALISELSS